MANYNKKHNYNKDEKIYWWISVALLASTPFLIAVMSKQYSIAIPGSEIDYLWQMNIIGIFSLGVGAIILNIIITVIRSPNRKMWINNPSVTVEHRIAGDIKRWIALHVIRLDTAGFTYSMPSGGKSWTIRKDGNNETFLNGIFSGRVKVSEDGSGVLATLDLTHHEQYYVAGKVYQKLTNLAENLLWGKSLGTEKYVPDVLGICILLAMATHALFYVEFISGVIMPVFAASILTITMAIFGLIMIAANTEELIGIRIAIADIVAGSAPLVALLVSSYIPASG